MAAAFYLEAEQLHLKDVHVFSSTTYAHFSPSLRQVNLKAELSSVVSIDMKDCRLVLNTRINTHSLDQESANFPVKGLRVSVTITELCHCSKKAAIDKTTNEPAVFQ